MMKRHVYSLFCAVLLAIPVEVAQSQDGPMDLGPRMREGRPPMPMPGERGQGMSGRRGRGVMMKMMRDNPKLAGMMMQMRGEQLSKMGDVLKRYGERLEKEGVK